jgi:hypothetical protein
MYESPQIGFKVTRYEPHSNFEVETLMRFDKQQRDLPRAAALEHLRSPRS